MSDNIRFIIGIDAGGSKTIARLINLQSNQEAETKAGSGSLTNDTNSACNTIHDATEKLLTSNNVKASETVVVCGAAGAENDQNYQQLYQTLQRLNVADIVIKTDAFISLVGATSGQAGIVVALGTGSIALRLDDDHTIQQFGGWGFKVGDQGSGAHLGRSLVIEVLKAYDRKQLECPLVQHTLAVIGEQRQSMLRWIKSASARDFAALCPIILQQRLNSPLAQQLIEQAIDDIEALITLARGDSNLPVFITGGLGKQIMSYLPSAQQSWCSVADKDAIDGAILIGRQHIATRQ